MDRRTFLAGTAFAGVGLFSQPLFGETQRGAPDAFGRVPTKVFVKTPQVVKQACPYWCWAASISMIFACHNRPVDQRRIVATVFGGSLVCTTGDPRAITDLLSRSWVDDHGRSFRSRVTAAYNFFAGIDLIDNAFIASNLHANMPLLYCNKHHAMVQVTFDFMAPPFGPPQEPMSVGVLDPWPGSPDFHYLQQRELLQAHRGGDMTYLAAVSVV